MRRNYVAVAALLLSAGAANAGITVWLDDTNLGARLAQLSAAVPAFGAFTPAETTQLQNQIINSISTAYNIPGVTWAFAWGPRPGANALTDEVFFFGQNYAGAGGAPYGDADRLDWRNPKKNDTGRIYVKEFDLVLAAIQGQVGPTRAAKIDQLGVAIGQTAAHELGHNLGLKHRDCFGNVLQANYGATGGIQKQSIMSSGSSGLGDDLSRTAVRTFNGLERAKLGFADGLANAPVTAEAEAGGDAGQTVATAQAINLRPIPTSPGYRGTDVVATLGAADKDWYKFNASAKELLTADIFSKDCDSPAPGDRIVNSVDCILRLYQDVGGVAVLIPAASNDDLRFNGTGIFIGAGGENSLDSFILNFAIPADGVYYVEVDRAAAGGSNYEVAIFIPTPGTASLLGLAMVGAIRRRRR